MKLFKFWLLALVAFFAISCQKELSVETNGNPITGGGSGGGTGGGSASGTLLSKIVTKDLLDSLVETFGYNANKKLTSYSIIGASIGGGDRDERYTFTRDASDRITQAKEIEAQSGGSGYDTTITTVYYTNATATTIAYTIAVTNSTDIDSVAYTYTSGKISKTTTYAFGGSAYSVSDESVYTYDVNGNLTNVKTYDVSTTPSTQIFERTYTYDAKITSLKIGTDEAVLTTFEWYGGNNNITKIDINDMAFGLGDITINSTYTYRSDSRPDKATLSVVLMGTPIPLPSTSTYYYQ
jgi:hypothetical protein